MKKTMILAIIGAMTLTVSSCGKDATQDAYDNVGIEQASEQAQGSADLVQSDVETETNLEQEQDANEVSDATQEENPEENIEEPEETQTYVLASEMVDYGIEALMAIEGELVEDEQLNTSLEELMHQFYYNYFFTPSINPETGVIEASNMALFAISYIMQHDYEGLAFDYATYELTIPREHVAKIVAEFFQRELDVHGSHEAFNVVYDEEKECYTVIIEDDQWEVNLTLNEVRRLNDTTYRIICDLPRKTSGLVEHQIESIVTIEKDTPIVIYYKIREAQQATEETAEEETVTEE
ncbi:hypothetical protein QBE53_10600 [Vallitaleaceae bacterium 9-2]